MLDDTNVSENFYKIRKNYTSLGQVGGPFMYISSKHDLNGAIWNDGNTSIIILEVQKLAKKCLKHVLNSIKLDNEVGIFDLFVNPTKYAVSIPLLKSPIKKQVFKNFTKQVNIDYITCFISELKLSFGNVAEFYYDCYNPLVIGIKWKYFITDDKEFKIGGFISGFRKDDLISFNKDAVVDEMKRLGLGLVVND